jgi:bifunctional UDP-N-acetylglucosamine pyrophosphorylase/glucosamine-1-phosphate N-acetyltransferase
MSIRQVSAVVLAAGEGVRMQSERPKPLHLLCGRPLLLYVIDALAAIEVDRAVVVVGSSAERVTKRVQNDVAHLPIEFVEQGVPRGTGDALAAALTVLGDDDLGDDDVIVLPGDMPLLDPASVAALVRAHQAADAACTVLVARPDDPAGRARVLRARDGTVARVVPAADLAGDPDLVDLAEVGEVSASVYCFRRGVLGPALRRLTPDNPDREFRLPDVVAVLHRAGYRVGAVGVGDDSELAEVDDRLHLAEVEAELRRRINHRWLAAGVTMVDPATCYVDATVALGRDVTLFPNTLLQGRTVVGEGAEIGPDTRLVDCVVGATARVEKTVGHDAEVGDGAQVGPFVVLRPGAQVEAEGRVAPFSTVEMSD